MLIANIGSGVGHPGLWQRPHLHCCFAVLRFLFVYKGVISSVETYGATMEA
jgi:hypothetical protein